MPKSHEHWMKRAIALAKERQGLTHPNPCVGAVLVKNNRALGEGTHKKAGTAHAEIVAFGEARRRGKTVSGSTLYVTLEPCSTAGKTPPCTQSIIESRVPRVVIGTNDPNPIHDGKGIQILREAGVEVIENILESECRKLNHPFNHWVTTGRPWVIAKAAISLNGKLATPVGEERWITGPEARRDVHQLRSRCGAILVGAATARKDNPHLTVRGLGNVEQPWRVVVTKSGNVPRDLHLFTDRHKERSLLFKNKPWKEILEDLGQRNVLSLMVEGGEKTFFDLVEHSLINEVCLYYAPKYFNDPNLASAEPLLALQLEDVEVGEFGQDRRLRGVVKE